MRANRAADTAPERALRRALRAAGFSGYRLNWKQAQGRPDIAFPGRRIVVFVHGCFWHRCLDCRLPLPKTNRKFWVDKFRRNRARDGRKRRAFEAEGWRVFEYYECQLVRNAGKAPTDLSRALKAGRR